RHRAGTAGGPTDPDRDYERQWQWCPVPAGAIRRVQGVRYGPRARPRGPAELPRAPDHRGPDVIADHDPEHLTSGKDYWTHEGIYRLAAVPGSRPVLGYLPGSVL